MALGYDGVAQNDAVAITAIIPTNTVVGLGLKLVNVNRAPHFITIDR